MSYPLYAITKWNDKENLSIPDEDVLFDKIPEWDREYVHKDEHGEDRDGLRRAVEASLTGSFDGMTVDVIGGEQGARLTIPRGSVRKFVKDKLDYARQLLGTGHDLDQEDEMVEALAYGTGNAWALADIFHKSYVHTLWYDEGYGCDLEDTIRYFGERMKDNDEQDLVFRVYCLYYHK